MGWDWREKAMRQCLSGSRKVVVFYPDPTAKPICALDDHHMSRDVDNFQSDTQLVDQFLDLFDQIM